MPASSNWFHYAASPNTVVDITEYSDQKFEAIALHRTQMNEQLLAMYRTYFQLRVNLLTQGEAIGEGLKIYAKQLEITAKPLSSRTPGYLLFPLSERERFIIVTKWLGLSPDLINKYQEI